MKLRHLRWRLLSHITFGKMKEHYKRKWNIARKYYDNVFLIKEAICDLKISIGHALNEQENEIIKIKKQIDAYKNMRFSVIRHWCKVIKNGSIDISIEFASDINNFYVPKICDDMHIYFNLDALMKENPSIKRFGLVFFMGIGDYFYATNFIEYLRKKYSFIKFDAYVSKNFDGNNSPLVGKVLATNPNFEKIYYFDGCQEKNCWKNYEYSECYRIKSNDTFLLPMIYQYNPNILSRTETLCETFGIKPPAINPLPIIYDYKATDKVKAVFSKQCNRMKKVVFFQGTGRSSNFTYNQNDDIISGLLSRGFFVISVEKTNITNENLLKIDINDFSINETISLLRIIKQRKIKIYILCVASCFASISAGLKLPALIIQHRRDDCIKTVYYSNAFLITNELYKDIPRDRQFLSEDKDFVQSSENKDIVFFNNNFVLKCFDDWSNILKQELF